MRLKCFCGMGLRVTKGETEPIICFQNLMKNDWQTVDSSLRYLDAVVPFKLNTMSR